MDDQLIRRPWSELIIIKYCHQDHQHYCNLITFILIIDHQEPEAPEQVSRDQRDQVLAGEAQGRQADPCG